MSDEVKTLVGIGEVFSRVMDHAPGTRIPVESWPAHLRKKCWYCEDSGAELYVHPDYPDRPYRRPCIHCDEGKRTRKAWCLASEELKNGYRTTLGPWCEMDPEMQEIIMARPCAHGG